MAKGGTIKPPENVEEIENCDDLDTLTKWLDLECKAWDNAGMHTTNVQVDGFMLDLQMNTLIHYLIDKGVIDFDEVQLRFKRNIMLKMFSLRQETEPRIRQARLDSLKAQIMPPEIFGPNGHKLG